jgi:protein TonB
MLVSSIFIIIEKTSPKKQITSVIAVTEPVEIEESRPITFPAETGELSEKSAVIPKEIPDRIVELPGKTESEEPVTPAIEGRIAVNQEKKAVVKDENELESREFEAVQDTTPYVRLDPSLSALSEVVVVGYGVAKDVSGKEDMQAGYIPPRPADGKSNFDEYIRENIRRPDTASSGQKVVVILNFIVYTDGSIDSIKIIKSPGKQFSEEAVRLLRSGPAWRPAEEDGKPVKDEVRLRIVFK